MSTTGNVAPQDFSAGDRISLAFADTPDQPITATVRRRVSDRQEGLAPEVEQYVDYWLEISYAGDAAETTHYVAQLTTGRYWSDGRYVILRKL